MYWISSRVEPTRDGPPAWGLGEMLTTPHREDVSCYEMFTQNFRSKGKYSANVIHIIGSPVCYSSITIKVLWNCITILRGIYCFHRQITVKMWTGFSRFTTCHNDEILPFKTLALLVATFFRKTTFCIEVSFMILTLNVAIIFQSAMCRLRSRSLRTS
jgi:hypothetical protein